MENKPGLGSRGSTRRTFLSASAVTAVAAPMLTRAASASAATADADLAATLTQLSTAQTQLQASYQLIAGVQNLSLAKYLS